MFVKLWTVTSLHNKIILQKKRYLKQKQADCEEMSDESNDALRRIRKRSLRNQSGTFDDTNNENMHVVKVRNFQISDHYKFS